MHFVLKTLILGFVARRTLQCSLSSNFPDKDEVHDFLYLNRCDGLRGRKHSAAVKRCGHAALMIGRQGEELGYLCRTGSQGTVNSAPVVLPRLSLSSHLLSFTGLRA